MTETPVATDEIFKTIIVISTPMSTKTSDRRYIFTVAFTVKVLAVNKIAQLRSLFLICAAVDV